MPHQPPSPWPVCDAALLFRFNQNPVPFRPIISRFQSMVNLINTVRKFHCKFPITGCNCTTCDLAQDQPEIPPLLITMVDLLANYTGRVVTWEFQMHIAILLHNAVLKLDVLGGQSLSVSWSSLLSIAARRSGVGEVPQRCSPASSAACCFSYCSSESRPSFFAVVRSRRACSMVANCDAAKTSKPYKRIPDDGEYPTSTMRQGVNRSTRCVLVEMPQS